MADSPRADVSSGPHFTARAMEALRGAPSAKASAALPPSDAARGPALPKRKGEGCPFPYPAVGPDPASVARDHPVHDRQSDPGARKLGRIVQPLKRIEEPADLLHVEPGPVV